MGFIIIDAHSHLWLKQDTVVEGLPIRTLENGRSLFMGEVRQMLPPFMTDGVNSAEVFLSNMDYAQVSAAVVTQEFIDGFQNDYLAEVAARYPDRFFVCGMCEFRKPGYLDQARQLIARGFQGIKIPAQRLLLKEGRVRLNCEEMMQMFHLMEQNGVLLSIDMADGATQVGELEEVIQECPKLKVAIGHFGMVIMAVRNFYDGKSGTELMGKKLGIHAYGNVGRNVARIAKGIGMDIYAYDAYCPKEAMVADGVKPVDSAEELYATCNVVSLHIPATAETKNSIDYDLVNRMPKNGLLVNTARKEVINEADLLRLMNDRPDLKYVTDIMPAHHDEFADHFPGRYFSTPKKMGAQTAEANINAGIAAARQIVGFLKDGCEKFRVNKK